MVDMSVTSPGLRMAVAVLTAVLFFGPLGLPVSSASALTQDGYDVRLEVGDDFQAIVDSKPPGTRYLIAAGVHREQQVVPSDGDRFTGEPGAVMSGARVLPAAQFVYENGLWWIGGQTQEGFVHGLSNTLPGRERDAHPEEVFADGSRRLLHVGSRSQLSSGQWFFDYEADRIWLADDPATFTSLETSTASFAFGGTAVRDVTLKNLVVEKYASSFQFGAIGGDQHNRYTYGWQLQDITARYNHGVGILVGPGMTVNRAYVHDNGQLGMGGHGTDPETGYSADVSVTNTEIAHNRVLGVNWGWEGGGAKFVFMNRMKFTNNWVHHNKGPGVWFDVENHGADISSNLIEDNENQGIFYEISSGGRIFWNTVRRNLSVMDVGAHAGSIDISNSSDTEVFENVVSDTVNGILLRQDGRRIEEGAIRNVGVRRNIVQIEDGHNGLLASHVLDISEWTERSGNTFAANTFHVDDLGARRFKWGDAFNDKLTSSEWLNIHDDTVIRDTSSGVLPGTAQGFANPVGPQTHVELGSDGSTSETETKTRAGGADEDLTAPADEIAVADPAPAPIGASKVIRSTGGDDSADTDVDPAIPYKACDAAVVDPDSPLTTEDLIRLAGSDRIRTSIEASRAVCGDGQAPAVVLARADDFPDAQTGTPLAVHLGAPLLLTGSEALHPETEEELQRLLDIGGSVHLLGGPAALSEAVADRIRNLGFATIRYNGANRFDTAVLVARAGLGDPPTVLLADGRTFPEPVIAGAVAAAQQDSGNNVAAAVLLTSGSNQAPESTAYLQGRGGSAQTIAIGTAATNAHPDAEAVAGATVFETSVAAAERFFAGASTVGIARVDDFPDALTGGALLGRVDVGPGAILLTDSASLPEPVASWLDENSDLIDKAVIFGGEEAVSHEVERQVRELSQ